MPTEPTGRRPLKTREWRFFKIFAALLARAGVTPNAISATSIVFGCCAGVALAATAHCSCEWVRAWWLSAAVFIQLRLIANLLDGMVAVEGGKGGPTGELWNEAPDRVADAAIFIGAGYAAGGIPVLGWAAALMAVFVAYVRALGASVGAGQCFLGPQAKPHRMAVMTFTCVLLALFPPSAQPIIATRVWDPEIGDVRLVLFDKGAALLHLALLFVIIGGLITAWRRLAFIADFLRKKSRL